MVTQFRPAVLASKSARSACASHRVGLSELRASLRDAVRHRRPFRRRNGVADADRHRNVVAIGQKDRLIRHRLAQPVGCEHRLVAIDVGENDQEFPATTPRDQIDRAPVESAFVHLIDPAASSLHNTGAWPAPGAFRRRPIMLDGSMPDVLRMIRSGGAQAIAPEA